MRQVDTCAEDLKHTLGADKHLSLAVDAVQKESAPFERNAPKVLGTSWATHPPSSAEQLMKSFGTFGFQATQLGRAVEEVNRMLAWRPSIEELNEDDSLTPDTKCTIWLSFTSNMISSGLREVFVFLAKHKLIDVVVTSAGGVEEDFIKCLAPTYLGDFHLKGSMLRDKGWNRIGNLIVPNDNYCLFEDWVQPLLDECLTRQEKTGFLWTPSRLIDFLGEKIAHEDSLYYWCHKNGIPVFCPGITDGSLGDNLFFHSYRKPGLVVDVVQDIRRVNDIAMRAKKSGMIILGGGIAKHHTCNANLMRNGADFAVFINTAQEFDGSDSGARPDEAISWGKIRQEAQPVKVYCDATIAFPLIVVSTFALRIPNAELSNEEDHNQNFQV